MTEFIKAHALGLGFDDVGIASAEQGTPYSKEIKRAHEEGRFGPLDYMERTLEERSDILKLMPEAKSVVLLVKNYYTGNHKDFLNNINIEDLGQKSKPKISRYAWGRDYHSWFKKRLRKFRKALEEKVVESGSLIFSDENSGMTAAAINKPNILIFNDIGPVLERGWAERAGLGFIGKSNLFISRKFGTWTFLGGFITDLELEYDAPWKGQNCGKCTKCLDACPTGALVGPNKLDAKRCISTWNIERPLLPEANQGFLKGHEWALGCDVCQEVCPWNKFQNETKENRFLPVLNNGNGSRVSLGLEDLGALKQEDLHGTALARPGAEGLRISINRALNKS